MTGSKEIEIEWKHHAVNCDNGECRICESYIRRIAELLKLEHDMVSGMVDDAITDIKQEYETGVAEYGLQPNTRKSTCVQAPMSDLTRAKQIKKELEQKRLEESAVALFNAPGKTVLNFLVESSGSVGVVPLECERCEKKFRPWRKMYTVYNKTERFKCICKKCIKPDELL